MNFAKHCLINKLDSKLFRRGHIKRVFREVSGTCAVAAPQSSTQEEEIVIPNRIERGASDILKALASTVGTDYTAPHYRYHDDPWLVPYTQHEKRDFWLSKESGRKAARFIAEKHPHLFLKNRIRDEPPITAFQPRASLNKDNVTTELLENYIQSVQVEDAMTVYNLLREKRTKISKEIQQDLLELLAFHAEEDETTSENRTSKGMLPNSTTWEGERIQLAEQLYSGLQTPEARLAMLMGLSKFKEYVRTQQVWGEIEANKDAIPIEGYNAMITALTSENIDKFKEELTSLLSNIKSAGLSPDAGTLEASLSALARMVDKPKFRQEEILASCGKLSLSIIAEFKNVGVEPSLGAYKNVLDIFYAKGVREKKLIVKDILEELQNKKLWPAQTMSDFRFFTRAMEVAFYLGQIKIAYSIHDLLHTGDHINLLTNERDSTRYYDCLMILVIRNEPIDVAWNLYNKLTPHIWSPNTEFFQHLIAGINTKKCVHYLGKFYDDLELNDWGNTDKEAVYSMNKNVLQIMDSNPSATSEYSNLSETYASVAQRIFEHLRANQADKKLYLRFNKDAATICSLAIKILLIEGKFENACEVFEFCVEEKDKINGNLEDTQLELFMDALIEENNVDKALQVVDYLLSIRSPKANTCALNLANSINLSNNHKEVLNKYFSNDQEWVNL